MLAAYVIRSGQPLQSIPFAAVVVVGLTGAILPCSYRLSLANCGAAVVSY